MKLLASDIIFRKIVHKNTFALTLPCFIWESRAIKTRPHRSYCFLSMFKLRFKRHYRNLATYSWWTTWREHVTKTAPARRRHSVGGAAAAAAHSSSAHRVLNAYSCSDSTKTKLLACVTWTDLYSPILAISKYMKGLVFVVFVFFGAVISAMSIRLPTSEYWTGR